MSPYRDEFQNFVSMAPKSISAADKRTFMSYGRGDVLVKLPLGEKTSLFILQDVLYAPSMAGTLISIGCIDSAGF
ncbi:hypothetical protein BV25DRAFT_1773831, partial [Artomyces pyxidatus]